MKKLNTGHTCKNIYLWLYSMLTQSMRSSTYDLVDRIVIKVTLGCNIPVWEYICVEMFPIF